MAKKCLNWYFVFIALLVLCVLCVVTYDCFHFICGGEFVLLRELNMTKFKSGNAPFEYLDEASKYMDFLWDTGYSRNDFWHVFISYSMTLSVGSTILFLIIMLLKKDILKKYSKIAVFMFTVITFILLLSLRIFTAETYATPETKLIYPIAYILIPY